MNQLQELKNEWIYEYHYAFVQPNPFQELYKVMWTQTDKMLQNYMAWEVTPNADFPKEQSLEEVIDYMEQVYLHEQI